MLANKVGDYYKGLGTVWEYGKPSEVFPSKPNIDKVSKLIYEYTENGNVLFYGVDKDGMILLKVDALQESMQQVHKEETDLELANNYQYGGG